MTRSRPRSTEREIFLVLGRIEGLLLAMSHNAHGPKRAKSPLAAVPWASIMRYLIGLALMLAVAMGKVSGKTAGEFVGGLMN